MAIETTLSRGFQITLPSAVRKKLGLAAGDRLEMDTEGNSLLIRKAKTLDEQLDEMRRCFETVKKNRTPEQVKMEKKMAGWTVNQYHEYFDNLPETKKYIKEKYGV